MAQPPLKIRSSPLDQQKVQPGVERGKQPQEFPQHSSLRPTPFSASNRVRYLTTSKYRIQKGYLFQYPVQKTLISTESPKSQVTYRGPSAKGVLVPVSEEPRFPFPNTNYTISVSKQDVKPIQTRSMSSIFNYSNLPLFNRLSRKEGSSSTLKPDSSTNSSQTQPTMNAPNASNAPNIPNTPSSDSPDNSSLYRIRRALSAELSEPNFSELDLSQFDASLSDESPIPFVNVNSNSIKNVNEATEFQPFLNFLVTTSPTPTRAKPQSRNRANSDTQQLALVNEKLKTDTQTRKIAVLKEARANQNRHTLEYTQNAQSVSTPSSPVSSSHPKLKTQNQSTSVLDELNMITAILKQDDGEIDDEVDFDLEDANLLLSSNNELNKSAQTFKSGSHPATIPNLRLSSTQSSRENQNKSSWEDEPESFDCNFSTESPPLFVNDESDSVGSNDSPKSIQSDWTSRPSIFKGVSSPKGYHSQNSQPGMQYQYSTNETESFVQLRRLSTTGVGTLELATSFITPRKSHIIRKRAILPRNCFIPHIPPKTPNIAMIKLKQRYKHKRKKKSTKMLPGRRPSRLYINRLQHHPLPNNLYSPAAEIQALSLGDSGSNSVSKAPDINQSIETILSYRSNEAQLPNLHHVPTKSQSFLTPKESILTSSLLTEDPFQLACLRDKCPSTGTESIYQTENLGKPSQERVIWRISQVISSLVKSGTPKQSPVAQVDNIFHIEYYPTGKNYILQVSDSTELPIPSFHTVMEFLLEVIVEMQATDEVAIIALIYLQRYLAKYSLPLTPSNWLPLLFISTITSSKFWDDESMQNYDFSVICPFFNLEELCEMETVFLLSLDYVLNVSGSLYALYFFELRQIETMMNADMFVSIINHSVFGNKHSTETVQSSKALSLQSPRVLTHSSHTSSDLYSPYSSTYGSPAGYSPSDLQSLSSVSEPNSPFDCESKVVQSIPRLDSASISNAIKNLAFNIDWGSEQPQLSHSTPSSPNIFKKPVSAQHHQPPPRSSSVYS